MGVYGFFAGVVGVLHLLLLYVGMFFMCNVIPILSMLFISPIFSGVHQFILTRMAKMAWLAIYGYAHVMGGMQPVYYGDIELIKTKHNGSKILMSNHVSMTDSVVIFSLAGHLGEEAHIRAYAKKSLAYQPVIGWFWWMLNFIFLKRDYEKDKKKIQAQLKSLVEKAKQYSTGNFWLMIFPEGTRLKPKKLAQAQAFSKEKGLPVFNHCLVPRIKGLQASIDGVRDAVDGILDVTVGYTERDAKGKIQPSLETILFGKGVSRKIHVHVAFVPISEIPSDSDGIYKWTMERFVIKDKLLAEFEKTGKFPGGEHAFPPITATRVALNYIAFLTGAAVVAAGCWFGILLARAKMPF